MKSFTLQLYVGGLINQLPRDVYKTVSLIHQRAVEIALNHMMVKAKFTPTEVIGIEVTYSDEWSWDVTVEWPSKIGRHDNLLTRIQVNTPDGRILSSHFGTVADRQ